MGLKRLSAEPAEGRSTQVWADSARNPDGWAHQLGTRALQREAQPVAFVQIALHGGLCRVGAVHATLPGQGIATAASRTVLRTTSGDHTHGRIGSSTGAT